MSDRPTLAELLREHTFMPQLRSMGGCWCGWHTTVRHDAVAHESLEWQREEHAAHLESLGVTVRPSVPVEPRPDADAEWLRRAVFKVSESDGGEHWEFTDEARHSVPEGLSDLLASVSQKGGMT